MELGEVEHHICSSLQGVQQVAVGVYRTDAGANLVSWLSFNHESWSIKADVENNIFMPMTNELREKLVDLFSSLKVALPRYMVPSLFIPCAYMPTVTATKLDRKTLGRMTESPSPEDVASYSLVRAEKRAPETSMERTFQLLWADIFGIPLESIGRDDIFLALVATPLLPSSSFLPLAMLELSQLLRISLATHV